MSVAARRSRQRDQPAAVAFPLVIGSLRFDLTVEGSHLPVVPMSVRLCGYLWAGDGRAAVGAWPSRWDSFPGCLPDFQH